MDTMNTTIRPVIDLSTTIDRSGKTLTEIPHLSFCACSGCGLTINPEYNPSYTPPPEQFLARSSGDGSSANNGSGGIVVNFAAGFTPEAQAAFQFAADIWNSLLVTTVPIVINATFQPAASPSNLGSAGLETFFLINGSFIPVGLVNQLTGSDQNAADPEINANFNSNRTDWYFGTDGNVPSGKVDFVSVVLHEIGHGLGFVSSAAFNSGTGSFNNPPIKFDTYRTHLRS